MIIFKKAGALAEYLGRQQQQGKKTGFVPTMGALHEGHLSLIETCKTGNDLVVCSIFVNPTQFNNAEDFRHYPSTIGQDIAALEKAGASVLFLPSESEIYPPEHIKKNYDLGKLEQVLEGKFRPGHFQGVCEVMERLLRIVQPNRLYMGQKDYQQCMVVQRLLHLLQLPITPYFLATHREPDGLAMSSRNLRLSAIERKQAAVIYRALAEMKKEWPNQPVKDLEEQATRMIEGSGMVVDYVSIANAATLDEPAGREEKLVALVAASIGRIRLIDNMLLN